MEKKIEKNVIVAVFKVESEGFQAFTELRQAAGGESHFVSAAALVKKTNDGCEYLDGFDTGVKTADSVLKGELIGMTIGLLGGPLGVLLGGGTGALAGMSAGADNAAIDASMIEQIAGKLGEGMVAIIALAEEESPEALDAKLSKYDAVIARFDADKVADEVDKAYEEDVERVRQDSVDQYRERMEEIQKDLEENFEILSKNFTK